MRLPANPQSAIRTPQCSSSASLSTRRPPPPAANSSAPTSSASTGARAGPSTPPPFASPPEFPPDGFSPQLPLYHYVQHPAEGFAGGTSRPAEPASGATPPGPTPYLCSGRRPPVVP